MGLFVEVRRNGEAGLGMFAIHWEEWKLKKRALELRANYASYTHLEPLWRRKIESALALRTNMVARMDEHSRSDRE